MGHPRLNPDDYIGKHFGDMIILRLSATRHPRGLMMVEIRCNCGVIKDVKLNDVVAGRRKSCGCRMLSGLGNTTHGLFKSPPYYLWQNIKKRCYDPTSKSYKDYGGRGIYVCDEWKNDFKTFYDWCYCNGFEKGLQLDRENNFDGYTPNNCRFVTGKINCRNKRNNHILTFEGKSKTIAEWSEITGLSYQTIIHRVLTFKWDTEKALTTPSKATRPVRRLRGKPIPVV